VRPGEEIVLGIDQGTTNSKVVALDRGGKVVGSASRPIPALTPADGWVEQDPERMVRNVIECIREVLDKTACPADRVVGLGIANQTETLVIWDPKTGTPAIPAIVWQCRRGTAEAKALRERGHFDAVKQRTGLDLDPTFTALKIKWVIGNLPGIGAALAAGELLLGTVDTWLIWRLTGGAVYATEPGNASRTMLFDIDRLQWSGELLELFGLTLPRLAECRGSGDGFGATDPQLFGKAIPITAALGDQQASLFGHGCFDKGELKVTYGTGAFVWVNAGSQAQANPGEGLIRTIAWHVGTPTYAWEGFVMHAGSALDWVGERLGLGGGVEVVREAAAAGGSGSAIMVPAFQGLATPWWDPGVRAAFLGLSAATTRGQLAHAAVESLCYQVRAVLDAVERAVGHKPPMVWVDGGISRSDYLMQLQADILATPLVPAASDLTTPIGSAMLAGWGGGFWAGLAELRRLIHSGETVRPAPGAPDRWQQGYIEWRRAVETVMAFHAQRGL
jgi:glycerol kinase